MEHSKWLAKLGATGYDALILINRMCNFILQKMGRGKISFSKKVKDRVKSAVAFINKFESTVCDIAASNDYKYVICGHIHEPCIKTMVTDNGPVCYLNSGDWIENLTALEYTSSGWELYRYADDPAAQAVVLNSKQVKKETNRQLFDNLLAEIRHS